MVADNGKVKSADGKNSKSLRITLLFKHQALTYQVPKQILNSLSVNYDIDVKLTFTSKKLVPDLGIKEGKPITVRNQCFYLFKCNLCDGNYVGYTAPYNNVFNEHSNTVLGKHLVTQ